MVSRVAFLNRPEFVENFLASTSLQQFQVRSRINTRELKWLGLWQATENLQK